MIPDPKSQHAGDRIPVSIRQGIDGYVKNHREVGHFLTAVLTNNLTEAVFRADLESLRCLHDIMIYVYNYIPGSCWGSNEKYQDWIKNKPKPEEVDP